MRIGKSGAQSFKQGPEKIDESSKNVGIASRRDYLNQLVEDWSSTSVGIKLDEADSEVATIVSNQLENQWNHIMELREDMVSSLFKTTPENVMRIVRIGTANSNRYDFATEWPLTTTDDAIYFVKSTYGDTLRGATAGNYLYETSAPDYASSWDSLSLGAGDGVTVVFSDTITTVPLVPFHVQVSQAGKVVAVDDGAGNLVGTAISAGTVNYTTGAISVTFSVAPLTGEAILARYIFDAEDSGLFAQFGTLELEVYKDRFDARMHPLGYKYHRMVELTLGTAGIGDVEDMLVRRVGDAHAMRRDEKAIQLMRSYALRNAVTTFNSDFAAAGEQSDYSHAQKILSTIDDVDGQVYQDIRRAGLNRAICGRKALTYLKKNKLWKTDMTQPRVGSTYLAGSLDNLKVYASVSQTGTGLLEENEVLLSYKNPQEEGEVAIAFGVLTEMAAALDYPTFNREGNIATVEDHMVIQDKFLRLVRISNLP